MKVSVVLAVVMAAAVSATPTPPHVGKRQLAPVPPDCGDVDTYQLCAAVNSLTCYSPLPLSIAQWYVT